MPSIKKQLEPIKTPKFQQLNKSKGILDDFAVRKSVNTREGRITHTPTVAKDIVNKEYVDLKADGIDPDHTHSKLVASDGTPDPALSVDANGNVGIGATKVNTELNINDGGGITGHPRIQLNDRATIAYGTQDALKGLILQAESGKNIFFNISGATEAMRINSIGNVGIGMAPSTKLSVAGPEVRFQNTGDVTLRIDTIGGSNDDSIILFGENTVVRGQIYWDGGTNNFTWSSTVGDINLMPSANVGIGTETPDTKLDIDGELTVRGSKVHLDSTVGQKYQFQTDPLPAALGAGSGIYLNQVEAGKECNFILKAQDADGTDTIRILMMWELDDIDTWENFEGLNIEWNTTESNVQFSCINAGTGTARDLVIAKTTTFVDGGNVGVEVASPQEKLAVGGNIVLPKATGNGIKVDNSTPTFPWKDLLGDQFAKNTGGTRPTLTTYNSAIDAWRFGNGDEAFMTFHIPHDYVAGTDIHLHIHWSQISATGASGALDFKYSAIYAKGHNQSSGSAFTSTPITGLFSSVDISVGAGATQYQHHLTEVVISAASATAALFDRDDLEPDGVIELTFEMVTNNLVDGDTLAIPDPFIHYVDIHYQSTNIGTKQKAPNFYA